MIVVITIVQYCNGCVDRLGLSYNDIHRALLLRDMFSSLSCTHIRFCIHLKTSKRFQLHENFNEEKYKTFLLYYHAIQILQYVDLYYTVGSPHNVGL